MKKKITTTLVNALEPRDKPYKIHDAELTNFFVRVSCSGTKTYAIRYRSPLDYKDKTFTIGRSTQIPSPEARRIALAAFGDIARGIDPQAAQKQDRQEAKRKESSTLGGFMNNHYETFLLSERKSGERLIKDIQSAWGHLYDSELTEINEWLITNWRKKRQDKGIKPSTLNRQVALLKALLNKAVDWVVIDKNPLQRVKKLKEDKMPVIRYLAKDEQQRLYATLADRDREYKVARTSANQWRIQRGYRELPNIAEYHYADHLTPLTILCINTGLRRKEALELAWERVDLNRAMITVIGYTGKNSTTRYIPLTNEAVICLRNWQKQQQRSTGLIFENPQTGLPFKSITTSWKNLMKAADIQQFRFHDLRHHFASSLVMKGVDLNTVRELMGHSDIQMTLRYAHLAPEHKAEAISRLNDKDRMTAWT